MTAQQTSPGISVSRSGATVSEPVRVFVDTLRAEHRYGADWLGFRRVPDGYDKRVETNRLVAIHPLVRVHLEVERVLHRVTLVGEVPVGPDGREPELVEGVPFVETPVFAATR